MIGHIDPVHGPPNVNSPIGRKPVNYATTPRSSAFSSWVVGVLATAQQHLATDGLTKLRLKS